MSDKDIRAWALEQGYAVGARGRLPREVRQAYADEHGDAGPVPVDDGPAAPWGCPRCLRRWSGLAQCHCSTCHHHFSTVGNFDKHRAGGFCSDPATMTNILKAQENRLGTTWVGAGENPHQNIHAEVEAAR